MENFDEIESALHDVSNTHEAAAPDQTSSSPPQMLEPTQQAAARGWTAPVAFEYQQYADTGFTGWAGNATRYEWSDEYGDVGPRNEELEKQLFQTEYISRAGLRLDRYVHTHLFSPR